MRTCNIMTFRVFPVALRTCEVMIYLIKHAISTTLSFQDSNQNERWNQ